MSPTTTPAHNVVNKFDKDAAPGTGDVLAWNGTVYVPTPPIVNAGNVRRRNGTDRPPVAISWRHHGNLAAPKTV